MRPNTRTEDELEPELPRLAPMRNGGDAMVQFSASFSLVASHWPKLAQLHFRRLLVRLRAQLPPPKFSETPSSSTKHAWISVRQSVFEVLVLDDVNVYKWRGRSGLFFLLVSCFLTPTRIVCDFNPRFWTRCASNNPPPTGQLRRSRALPVQRETFRSVNRPPCLRSVALPT